MKPCVTAFGGEQFNCPQQSKELDTFFSYFYITLNAGALVAVFVTPIMRDDVKCFGESSCFPLAFGANAVFMLLSLGKQIQMIAERLFDRPSSSLGSHFSVWKAFLCYEEASPEHHYAILRLRVGKFPKAVLYYIKSY